MCGTSSAAYVSSFQPSPLRSPHRRPLSARRLPPQSCEEYIRSLTPTLPPSTLSSIPDHPTRLLFIGCGAPELIPRYRARTMGTLLEAGEEAYALYADPTQRIYRALGMVETLTNPATAPGYISTGYWSKVATGRSTSVR